MDLCLDLGNEGALHILRHHQIVQVKGTVAYDLVLMSNAHTYTDPYQRLLSRIKTA